MTDSPQQARFDVGQLVRHRMFGYRGVVVDVDPRFNSTEEWYEQVAKSRPPKDRPWYHVLVHDAEHNTYVAERNLDADASGAPINHPGVAIYFDELHDGRYLRSRQVN